MTTVGLVGLGLMGSVIARYLLASGYEVRGWDLDAERRREQVERGGIAVGSLEEAAVGAGFVVLSLPHGGVVRDACLGDGGLVDSAASGTIVIDTSTSKPEDSIATAKLLAAHGIEFLDASVSGTSKMAAEGDLITMVGGTSAAYDRAGPVLDAFTRARYHLGPVGSGATSKLVINHVMNLNRSGLAEGLVFAEQAGLELSVMLEVLMDSAASSKAMDVWGQRMINGQHLPPGGHIRTSAKDMGLIVETARAAGAPVFLASALHHVLQVAMASGLAEADSSATMEVFRRIAGTSRFSMENDVAGGDGLLAGPGRMDDGI